MSKRLQVLFDEGEYREIQRLARRQRVTVADWVRHALRAARSLAPVTDPGRKLAVVRAAVRHDFPTAGIDQMLADIERGYATGRAP